MPLPFTCTTDAFHGTDLPLVPMRTIAVFTAVSAATAFTMTAFTRGLLATFTEDFNAFTSSVPLKKVCALHAEFKLAVAMTVVGTARTSRSGAVAGEKFS